MCIHCVKPGRSQSGGRAEDSSVHNGPGRGDAQARSRCRDGREIPESCPAGADH